MKWLTSRSLRWTESSARLGEDDGGDTDFDESFALIPADTEIPEREAPPPLPSSEELDR